jgi:hypothetical protein
MLALIRYNLKIVAPTLIWTGILVTLLVGMVLFHQFRHADQFKVSDAGSLAEHLIPLIAAFFSAGVLDAELKRGAHELLRSKRSPLWKTVAYRLAVSVGIALLIGVGILTTIHFGIKQVPLGMLLMASVPTAFTLALVSLWTRVRFGNVFIGYVVAVAVWVANVLPALMVAALGVQINPLLNLNSYTDRLVAIDAGTLQSTPYVDWWWVSKLALCVVSGLVFWSVTKRVEHLVEGD